MKRYGISAPILAVTLAGTLSFFSHSAAAQTPKPEGLFKPQATEASGAVTKRAYRREARNVRINRQKLRRGKFFVELPGNVSFEVVRELQHEMRDGRFAWVGHARGNANDRAVIGVSGDAVAGTFRYGDRMFKLEPRPGGEHVIREVSPRDPAPELDAIPVFDPTRLDGLADSAHDHNDESHSAGSLGAASADSSGAIIDVMVAYTPDVVDIYGEAGVQALIMQAVAETNQAYANSGVTTRINLVHTALTNYTTSGDMLTDLGRLRNTSDGHMDELHSLRDQYGADLVSLIDKQSGYCGLAYRMTTMSPFFASSAFSIVNHSCATGYYSFAHELGHNQGLHHDPVTAAGGRSVFSYAYGYQEPFGDFRTIMAYSCPGGCVRINHFSNPDVLHNGEPTGDAHASDNARAIDGTAAVVANFRAATVVLEPPASPSNLTTAIDGGDTIVLNWSDNASDESGFSLQRAIGDGPFSQLASLPANTTSYTDTPLDPGQTYTYRVRAWNSNGSSAFSDTASQWIEDETIIVNSYPIFSAGWARTSGTWEDSGEADGQVLTLEEFSTDDYPELPVSFMEYYWAIDVQPGETVTLHTDAYTTSLDQVFTFAYSTLPGSVSQAPENWVDMFVVSPWFPMQLEFTLPEGISGLVLISVRDSNREAWVGTSDTLHIDSLYTRTLGAEN